MTKKTNEKYILDIHTMDADGSQSDASKGHDWSISRGKEAVFYEGMCTLSLGEIRKFVDTLNKIGICADDWKKT